MPRTASGPTPATQTPGWPLVPVDPDLFMPASFWQSQNPAGSKEVGWTLCCATVKRVVGHNAPLKDRLQIVREHGRSLVLQPTAQQGIDILDHYLALRRPVMAGVTHTYAAGYNLGAPDYGTTDHFVGTDAKGKYYRFFDVGTKDKCKAKGIDPRNLLYYDARTGSYSDKSIATGRNYILSQLRSLITTKNRVRWFGHKPPVCAGHHTGRPPGPSLKRG